MVCKHHTKTAGDLGVLKAQLDLLEKGFIVSRPQTEHVPFDLVITNRSGSRTVQVKTRSMVSTGVVEIKAVSVWKNNSGLRRRYLDKSLVNLFCVYCPHTDKCYYVDSGTFSTSIKLRVRAPKNNQTAGINLADDYLEVP